MKSGVIVSIAAAVMLGCSAAAVSAAIEVPLTVTERAGVDRTGELAAGGVPLPRGAVKDTASFGVVDEAGKAVPAQFTVLNRWPSDGSVRWMLVEFPVTLAANKTKTFTLKQGVASPAPAKPVTVTQDETTITIGNGVFSSTIIKRGAEGPPIVIETVDGQKYSAESDPDATMTVEDAGPLRATLRYDGRHRNDKGEPLFACRTRATIYAGSSAVHLQYTFTHDQGAFTNTPVEVKSITLGVGKTIEGPLSARLGGTGLDHAAQLKPADVLRQRFTKRDEYVLTGAAQGTGKTQSAPATNVGWCSLGNGKAGTTVAVRWLWQLYPKAFTLKGDGSIAVELVPPDAAEPAYIYRGMRKTHDLLLIDAADEQARSQVVGFQQPLFVKCPTSWYCEETLGMGRLLSAGSKHLSRAAAEFDRKVNAGFEEQIAIIRRLRSNVVDRKREVDSYGMIHFGDGFHNNAGGGHRGLEWDNCYYSYTHLLALQYARSGSDAILDTLREAAAYEGDVGIGWITLDRAGPRQNPGKYHIGGFGSFNNHISGSWNFYKPIGMMEVFYLTGDRRYEDAALANFNWTLTADGFDLYSNPRSVGAGLRALVHGYLATGNVDFLHIARDVARKAERFYRAHGHFAPVQNSIFMCPNALSGLCTYQEFTGDQRLGRVLPEIVAAHFDRFAKNPARLDYAYMNLYAARLAGNDDLRKQVEEALTTKVGFSIQKGNHAIKDFAASKREVPLIFWYLSDLAGAPPTPWGVVDLGPERPDRAEIAGPAADGKGTPLDLVSCPNVARAPAAPTRLTLKYDPQNLYLGVQASEPRLDLLKVDIKEDGGPTYSDDCVEIFVGPNTRRFNVKLMVNAAGVRAVSVRGHYRKEAPAVAPADFPVTASRDNRSWRLDVTIPWAKVGIAEAQVGTEVAFNVIRYRVGRGSEKPGEASTWNGTSNEIESVGTLVLGK